MVTKVINWLQTNFTRPVCSMISTYCVPPALLVPGNQHCPAHSAWSFRQAPHFSCQQHVSLFPSITTGSNLARSWTSCGVQKGAPSVLPNASATNRRHWSSYCIPATFPSTLPVLVLSLQTPAESGFCCFVLFFNSHLRLCLLILERRKDREKKID